MKKKEWKEEYIRKVTRFITGIIAQYGKPYEELSELQQATLKQDIDQLVAGILYESQQK